MENIIPVMKKHDIRRIVSLTGGDARAPGDTLTMLHRLSHMMLSVVGHKVLRDSEKHIRLLSESNLDWTVLRSPIMNAKGNPFHFELSGQRPLPWQTIHRQSVVVSLLQAIEPQDDKDGTNTQAPYLRRI